MAFAAFAIMLLVVACSPANTDLSGTASLTVVANMPTGSGSKSIMPDADSTKPDKIIIELTQAGSEDVVQAGSFDYQESAEYTLNNIKIGTYTVTIKGTKADREGFQQQIMSGSSPITITADGENSCNVKLAFGSDGKGALEVKLVWEDLNSSSSPIADAIKNDSLGFLAYYNSGSHKDQPISGDLTDPSQLNDKIDWVDNVSSGEHIYYEYAEATGQAAADIYFIIYTKDSSGNITAVAKTFYSTLTIYPNILSIPDDNEISNFRLTASNVQGYLKNVTDVNVGIDEENDPSGILIVTWKNPDFSENVFPMDVVVKIVEENGTYTKTNTEHFNNAEASAAGGKTVFSGLNPNSTYSF